jgi:Fe2+ transport system protein FeoA
MSDAFSLANLKVGIKAKVVNINTKNDGLLRHLMAMEIAEGVIIKLESRFTMW